MIVKHHEVIEHLNKIFPGAEILVDILVHGDIGYINYSVNDNSFKFANCSYPYTQYFLDTLRYLSLEYLDKIDCKELIVGYRVFQTEFLGEVEVNYTHQRLMFKNMEEQTKTSLLEILKGTKRDR